MGKYLDMLKSSATELGSSLDDEQRSAADRRDDPLRCPPDSVVETAAHGKVEAAQRLLALCQINGIGIYIGGDGRLTIRANGRLWASLLAAVEKHVGAIRLLLPSQVTGPDGTINVIGTVRNSPPPAIEVARPVIEPRPSWNGGPPESEQLQAWIDGAIRAAAYHHTAQDPGWTPEQLERAREKLGEILEPGDRIESASNYKITVRKRSGQTLEVPRYDD